MIVLMEKLPPIYEKVEYFITEQDTGDLYTMYNAWDDFNFMESKHFILK